MQVRAAKGFLIKALLVVVAACSSASPAKEERRGAGPAENQVLFEGVRIDRFEGDRLRHRARIARARLDRADGTVTGEEVEAEVLERAPGDTAHDSASSGRNPAARRRSGSTESDEIRAVVRAPRMRSRLRSRTVTLEGGVTVTDRQGRTLSTETLSYDSARDWLETAAPVSIEGENFDATGGRVTGHPRAGQLEVEGPSRARVVPSALSSSSRDGP